MAKKSFKELTPKGQKARLNKYEKERAERGTQESLARLVKPATIKNIKDGNKLAVFRLAIQGDETKFITASAFIKAGKEKLEQYYAGLGQGRLVSVEWKENNGYNNIYNLMDRGYADSSKAGDKPKEIVPAQSKQEPELPLEI